ncbi:MAG: helix-turn-helix transcriptional regulator [Clostridia bacterium]|nr:helix-turn-helix transcriptional regulator [Clostridia bacterium]
MKYTKALLNNVLEINGVYSVHYFEYMKNFVFPGESHPFWEIVYADKKSLVITAGEQEIVLEPGHLFIHKPDEFHSIRCDSAANSVIFSFDCDSKELMAISGRVITCGAEERQVLASIISEAAKVFATPLGDMKIYKLEKNESHEYGSQQLVRLYIEQLLIMLVRGQDKPVHVPRYESSRLLEQVCEYLESNIENRLRFDDVLKHFSTSASVIKKIFRDNMDCGIMEYFNRLKIEAAKQMIRDGNYNFTQIADRLSFNTSQYFTTVFRRVTGMNPSEYEDSVKSRFNSYDKY